MLQGIVISGPILPNGYVAVADGRTRVGQGHPPSARKATIGAALILPGAMTPGPFAIAESQGTSSGPRGSRGGARRS
jgi:hypothetical protein